MLRTNANNINKVLEKKLFRRASVERNRITGKNTYTFLLIDYSYQKSKD
jgi:hypothetical protein